MSKTVQITVDWKDRFHLELDDDVDVTALAYAITEELVRQSAKEISDE